VTVGQSCYDAFNVLVIASRQHRTVAILLIARIFFFCLGLLAAVWGGRIVFSDDYFAYWNEMHWKEPNSHQWSPESVNANRWGTGAGALIVCGALFYFMLFHWS
jgi:hypothetical protein